MTFYIVMAFVQVGAGFAIGIGLGALLWRRYKAEVKAWEVWNGKRLDTLGTEAQKAKEKHAA